MCICSTTHRIPLSSPPPNSHSLSLSSSSPSSLLLASPSPTAPSSSRCRSNRMIILSDNRSYSPTSSVAPLSTNSPLPLSVFQVYFSTLSLTYCWISAISLFLLLSLIKKRVFLQARCRLSALTTTNPSFRLQHSSHSIMDCSSLKAKISSDQFIDLSRC